MEKTHKHHIQYKCQGGGDELTNLIDLGFIEHAELHAMDFINGGPQFDFRHEGWPYLSKELRDACRAERSRRQSEKVGPKNHMFGRERPDRAEYWKGDNNPNRKPEAKERLRKHWEENLGPMFGEDNPFYGKHHSEETKKLLSEKLKGRPGHMAGKNHTKEAREKMSGPRPAMQGKKHWVNAEGKTVRSIECPGPEWQRGRKWKEQ